MSHLRVLIGASTPPDPNAGASGTVFQMAEALRRAGCEVETFWRDDLGRRIEHGNLHYLFELPQTYAREVRRRTHGRTFDVIELNQPHAYAAARDHVRSGRPGVFINRSHGHEVRAEEQLDRWRGRFGARPNRSPRRLASCVMRRALDRHWTLVSRYADGFVFSCREDAEFQQERFGTPADRIGVITQGVGPAFLRPITEREADAWRRVIYVGQLAFFKAPQVLAESVSRLLSVRGDAEMTWICSKADHARARGLLAENVRPRVTLLDWMPQDALVPLLDRHGVFVFPSFFEGFGKAPLEAMARGLCVVASDTGGMRDYIAEGKSGLLVPPGDAFAFADTTLRLMSDRATCEAISRTARDAAAAHTWDRCAADAIAFYERCLSRGHREIRGRL